MTRPELADHWANKWADLLQVNRKYLGEKGTFEPGSIAEAERKKLPADAVALYRHRADLGLDDELGAGA